MEFVLHGMERYVDSSPPPPPTLKERLDHRRLRPWYLVAAMVLLWLVGVSGLMSGCSTVMVLQQDSVIDVSAEVGRQQEAGDPIQTLWVVLYAAQFKATMEAHEITFPLNVAKLLLSGLLVVASVLAMGGRPGARGIALQALAANAIFAAVDYALTRSVRSGWIEAVGRVGDMIPRTLHERGEFMSRDYLLGLFATRQFWWWVERVRFLLLDLGIFGFAAVALTRLRTKMFFDVVAEATSSAEEEP